MPIPVHRLEKYVNEVDAVVEKFVFGILNTNGTVHGPPSISVPACVLNTQ